MFIPPAPLAVRYNFRPLFYPDPSISSRPAGSSIPSFVVVVVVGNSGAANLVRERGRDALRAAAPGKVGRERRDPHFPPPPPPREEERRKLCAREGKKRGEIRSTLPWEISPAEKPRLDGRGVGGGREGGRRKRECDRCWLRPSITSLRHIPGKRK